MKYFDPMGEDSYGSIIGDFNTEKCHLFFETGTFQRVDDDFYFFLCLCTNWSGVTPKYKPEEGRLPCFVSVLLYRTDYQINLKQPDGKYKQETYKSSPIDQWFIEHIEHNVSYYLDTKRHFSGWINFDDAMLRLSPMEPKQSPIQASSFFALFPMTPTDTLPNKPFKPSANLRKTSTKISAKNFDSNDVYNVYSKAIEIADTALALIHNGRGFPVDDFDRTALRIQIFNELWKSR